MKSSGYIKYSFSDSNTFHTIEYDFYTLYALLIYKLAIINLSKMYWEFYLEM